MESVRVSIRVTIDRDHLVNYLRSIDAKTSSVMAEDSAMHDR
jgi:hypothetical protein